MVQTSSLYLMESRECVERRPLFPPFCSSLPVSPLTLSLSLSLSYSDSFSLSLSYTAFSLMLRLIPRYTKIDVGYIENRRPKQAAYRMWIELSLSENPKANKSPIPTTAHLMNLRLIRVPPIIVYWPCLQNHSQQPQQQQEHDRYQ